jgi:ParB family chromosome partitioning protein
MSVTKDAASGKRKALGRGLAALIPGAPDPTTPASGGAAAVAATGSRPEGALRMIPIEELHPSAAQPRKSFDDARLAELAESLRTQGVIQPLVVRARQSGGGFEIIAGERRWRAAQRAGLHEVPAVVREVAETRAFEMALVENLQREDLNPIEEAEGFQRLISEFDYTQEMLATRVGKDRSTIANSLRLLKLPAGVRELVVDGRLSMGHARALLGLEEAPAIERVARASVARGLSVRAVEALVKRERDGGAEAKKPAGGATPSPAARDLGDRLQRALGTRVRVVEAAPGRGHLEIHYHSLDQLDELLERLLPS